MEMGGHLEESGRNTFEGPLGGLWGRPMFTMKQVEEMDRDEANFKCAVCANAYSARKLEVSRLRPAQSMYEVRGPY